MISPSVVLGIFLFSILFRKESTMKSRYLKHYLFSSCIGIILLGISFSLQVYADTVTGECRNPEACYECHTPEELEGVDIGCDRGTWSPTAPLNTARDLPERTVLKDGRVLITGGGVPPDFRVVDSAEILDPDTRTFTLLSATMSDPRWSHTTMTLNDGRVLVVGGRTAQNPSTPGARVLNSVDLFDPQTNSFTPTGSMNVARRSMIAVLLHDGRVLITGGGSAVSTGATLAIDSAEIYDPQTGTFKLLTSKMSVPRQYHEAITLQDGRVLIAGGSQGPGLSNSIRRVDIFDPITETFTEIDEMHSMRTTPAAALLRDGRVVFSGYVETITYTFGSDSELFDPANNTFTPIEKTFYHTQTNQYGVTLLDGTVMFPVGVNSNFQTMPTTYLYRPDTNGFVFTGSVQYPRKSVYPIQLRDGRLAIIGGYGVNKIMNNGEIYLPSVISQAQGLHNVVADVSAEAFRSGIFKYLMGFWVKIASRLIARENYEMASILVDNLIVQRADGCISQNELSDWITDCNEQQKVFYPARLLVKTLDELSGKLQPPMPTAQVDVTSGTVPLEVNFQGTATDPDGTITQYWWDFGDGASSTEQNPTYTYPCAGEYDVAFGVIDNDGLSTQQTSITIDVDYPEGFTASFSCDILVPIYQALVCTQCHHQGDDTRAGLDLSSYEGIMAGSDNGPVVIPGDPENSVVVQITDPPRNHAEDVGGKPFNQKMREIQRAWIAEGALDN
jgi:hypothetical protein